MSKGIRFFGTDYNAKELDGTSSASSRTANAQFAFDGLLSTKWVSDGEDTDGDAVYVEMDYGTNRTIDSLFVQKTNIEDVEVQYYSGSAWVTCNASIATVTKSADLFNLFVKLNASVTTQKVRVAGSNTVTPNEEKEVVLFRAFMQLGQFAYFPDFTPKITTKQNVFNTTDGRNFIIERGEVFSGKLDFKSHVNQADITLMELLIARKEPFFIWVNGGDESIFSYSYRPYRFEDIFKVSIVGDFNSKPTKNYYKAGYNNSVDIVEVI
jgi:hypothetical protein